MFDELFEAFDEVFRFLARELAPSQQADHRGGKERGQGDSHDRAWRPRCRYSGRSDRSSLSESASPEFRSAFLREP